MGRRPKQTFLQRGQKNGQKKFEKMVNITNYWRNANQNYNKLPSHTGQNAIIKKSTNSKCWRRCREKEALLHC